MTYCPVMYSSTSPTVVFLQGENCVQSSLLLANCTFLPVYFKSMRIQLVASFPCLFKNSEEVVFA